MKNLSVNTFIHILFSVAITILIITFIIFLSWDKDRQKIEEYKRYQFVSITFLSNLQQDVDHKKLKKLYKELNVKEIPKETVPRLKKDIELKSVTIFTGESSLGRVRVFKLKEKKYIYVEHVENNIMLQDDSPKNYYFEIAITLAVFLIGLLLLLYLAVLKKLYPLKTLHKQIEKFAKGDMKTRITYLNDDEIGRIAKNFDDAILHINELSSSKNLFMRNLMHELKTPITKGRIIVEMLDDEDTKKVLVRAFERMNELITELAEIERVTAQSFEPNFEYVMLSDICKESKELLMTQSSCIKEEIEDIALFTDKKLITLVIKNLIDNGMKYGSDKCVMVANKGKLIRVISKGEALSHSLAYYTEPFSQAEKRSSGFGLGLYIVNSILLKFGYKLGYEHKDGKNIFMLIPPLMASS